MRTTFTGPDLIAQVRASNEAPHKDTPDQTVVASEDHGNGGFGRSLAVAVALASICAALFIGVELTHQGSLFSTSASPAASANAPN